MEQQDVKKSPGQRKINPDLDVRNSWWMLMDTSIKGQLAKNHSCCGKVKIAFA